MPRRRQRPAAIARESERASMSPEKNTHLFISYATEDGALADWLARKLVNQGYAVWLDRLKMLGGEPWPQDIDVAIKERTFRMLALLSRHSIKKPNPSKERTLALSIAKSREIPDFMIPLKVDSAELDWLTSDLNYLPFNAGWADGWRQLLKKLESLNAPKPLQARTDIAALSFDAGEGLVRRERESIVTNALVVKTIPNYLSIFGLKRASFNNVDSIVDPQWAAFQVSESEVAAFGPPPGDPKMKIWGRKGGVEWKTQEEYEGISTANIIRDLIERTLRARLLRAGCQSHPKRARTYYLLPAYSPDGKLHFKGRLGKNTWCKIQGQTRVLRPGKPAEQIRHLFAFDLLRWHLSKDDVAIQIRPNLVLADATGQLMLDEKVGPLRRRLTKSWWNDKWLNRLLAAADVVIGAKPIPDDGIILTDQLLRIGADRSLNLKTSLDGVLSAPESGSLRFLRH